MTAAPADELRAAQLLATGGSTSTTSGNGDAAASSSQSPPPPPRSKVQQQLDALGDDHVGYRERSLPGRGVAVAGGRPFSKGGSAWSNIAPFMAAVCGVESAADSAARIVSVAAAAARRGDAVVLLAHNGPRGLGDARHDICGVDWK